MQSPTSKSLDRLRELGFLAGVVESWIPKIEQRRDLWGIADVLACHPRDKIFLLVQATSLSNIASRVAKAQRRSELAIWLRSGGLFEVWGWQEHNLRRIGVTVEEMATVVLERPGRQRRRDPGLFDKWI